MSAWSPLRSSAPRPSGRLLSENAIVPAPAPLRRTGRPSLGDCTRPAPVSRSRMRTPPTSPLHSSGPAGCGRLRSWQRERPADWAATAPATRNQRRVPTVAWRRNSSEPPVPSTAPFTLAWMRACLLTDEMQALERLQDRTDPGKSRPAARPWFRCDAGLRPVPGSHPQLATCGCADGLGPCPALASGRASRRARVVGLSRLLSGSARGLRGDSVCSRDRSRLVRVGCVAGAVSSTGG
jgi:hypothetical protein